MSHCGEHCRNDASRFSTRTSKYFGSLMENIVQINDQHTEEICSILRTNKSLEKITAIQKNIRLGSPASNNHIRCP